MTPSGVREAARRPDEPAGEAGRLEHAGLSPRDDLHVMPLRVGVAVAAQGPSDRRSCRHWRRREAARKRSTDHVAASACLGTEAKTPRAMRRMLPAWRCWLSIAVTTLSSGRRPTAAAYSARRKTGLALKKGAEICRGMSSSRVLFKSNRWLVINVYMVSNINHEVKGIYQFLV